MEYSELDSLIQELDSLIETDTPQRGHWNTVWTLIKEVGAAFKGTRYPTREDKDAAWKKFQALCDTAKSQSTEARRLHEERQREWESRQETSRRTLHDIEGAARGAQPLSSFERGLGDILLFPLKVIERVINDLLGIQAKTQLEEIREELMSCNETLRDAWTTFGDRKSELLGRDKAKCFEMLKEAQDKLNEAWTRWKEAKDSHYESQRSAWEEKQAKFKDRVSANIEKLEGQLSKAESALAHQERHLDDLKEKHADAYSDSFRDRCSGWIDETETRISDIKESIARLEKWLDEEREKLR